MNCPRCASQNIRRSQSQDSIWFRFVLQKMMRCQRCCYTFAMPVWEQPLIQPAAPTGATSSSKDLEPATASA